MKIKYIIASIALGLVVAYPFLPHASKSSSTSSPDKNTIVVQGSYGLDQRSVGQSAPFLGSAIIGPKKGDVDQGLQGAPPSIDKIIGNAEIKTR